MNWIIAAVSPESVELPAKAMKEFRRIGEVFPCAPWRIESGDLRGGKPLLEDLTGMTWDAVSMSPDEVRAQYERLQADEKLADPKGMTAVLIAFLEVCSRYNLGLEGGLGARVMRPTTRR